MATGSGTGTSVDLTLQVPTYERANNFSAVWVWDNSAGAYVDRTLAAQKTTDSAFSVLEESSDKLYLGFESRFDLAAYYLETLASIGALMWEFSRVADWKEFVPTNEYGFTLDGAAGFPPTKLPGWTPIAFSNSSPHSATPPDTTARYWMRVSTASVTTAPTVSHIEMRPLAAYCTPTEVANILQLKNDFTDLTMPTRASVEDVIASAQSYIDFKTKKSWRLNYKENEEHEFNISGVKLIHRFPRAITRVQVWNGSEYDTLREGRTNDYFLVAETGMMHFSRYFMLPARFVGYNAPLWRWGWGEFTFGIRVSYFYGSTIDNDSDEGRLAFNICQKLSAMQLMNAHDYSVLTVSGLDKVPMSEKVRNWQVDVEDQLESLRGWEIF